MLEKNVHDIVFSFADKFELLLLKYFEFPSGHLASQTLIEIFERFRVSEYQHLSEYQQLNNERLLAKVEIYSAHRIALERPKNYLTEGFHVNTVYYGFRLVLSEYHRVVDKTRKPATSKI